MENKQELKLLVDEYLKTFTTETERLKPFLDFLDSTEGTALYDRKNFVGHITASAFVVDEGNKKVLLLHHKFLEKWLQPGGHVDAEDESLLAAASREVSEETGIKASDLVPTLNTVFDIDSHPIPANPKKFEEAHVHHDIRFLLTYNSSNPLAFNSDEATAVRWVDFEELPAFAEFQIIYQKLMSRAPRT